MARLIPREWSDAFQARWIVATIVFLSIIGLSFLVIAFYPRTYRSTAELLIRVGRESVSLDPTSTGERMELHRTRESEINTTLQVMSGRQIASLVVEKLKPETILGSSGTKGSVFSDAKSALKNIIIRDTVGANERALIKLRSRIDISAPSESNVVTIEYRASSPELAKQVVDAWIVSFTNEHIRLNRNEGSFEFFERQESQLLKQLSEIEEAIRDNKTSFGIVSIEGQQHLLEQQLLEVRRDHASTKAALVASQARTKSLSDSLSAISEDTIISEVDGLEDTASEGMRQRLFDLEMQEKELDSRFTDSHPKLMAVRQQLAEVNLLLEKNEQSRQEVTMGLNPSHNNVSLQLLTEKASGASTKQRLDELASQHQQLIQELEKLNTQESTMNALTREYEVLKARYQAHSVKREQARLNDALSDQRISSIKIVQNPSLEFNPVTPKKSLCAILGFLAAVMGAFATVVLLEPGLLHFSAQPFGGGDMDRVIDSSIDPDVHEHQSDRLRSASPINAR